MAKKEKEKTTLTVVKDGVESEKEVNKPTTEEVEQYKADFSKALNEFNEKKWDISEPGKFAANDAAMYILEFMDKYAHWSKTEWMGMIKMEEELRKAMISPDQLSSLQLGYQALEYCAYMLSNPGGVGLSLAKEFEKQADKYSKIGILIGTKVEEARKELKDLQYLQEKWAAGEQGFYLADLEPKEEQKEEESANIGTVEIDLSTPESK